MIKNGDRNNMLFEKCSIWLKCLVYKCKIHKIINKNDFEINNISI
jgi:hypothetical protein